MHVLLLFDNDGVLRDESVSYEKAIRMTVATLDFRREATKEELRESRKKSNNDWDRTFEILKNRRVYTQKQKSDVMRSIIIPKFQQLYLGKRVDNKYTGYINDEPWLADNKLLERLSLDHTLAIVSGAPPLEIQYTLEKNKASKYFKMKLGMYEGSGKGERLETAINHFKPDESYFCDDRPPGIREAVQLKDKYNIKVFGIRPPQENAAWDAELLNEGAEKVFPNVNEYCSFLLNNIKKV